MKSKTLLIGVGVAIGLAIVLAGWQFVQSNYKLHGSVIDPAIPAADFTLVDQNGAAFRLSDQNWQDFVNLLRLYPLPGCMPGYFIAI